METSSKKILDRIKPTCQGLGKSINTSGLILVVIGIISFVIMIISTVMTYWMKNMDDASKAKYNGPMMIVVTIATFLIVVLGIWQVISTNNYNKCLVNVNL